MKKRQPHQPGVRVKDQSWDFRARVRDIFKTLFWGGLRV
jgi:hypothetical protein